MLKKLFSIMLLIFSLLLLFILGCDTKSSSAGDFDHIIVFSDSTLYNDIESNINQIFDNFIYTPHSERSFLHKWVPLTLLDNYSKRRNIIFIGLLNRNDHVSEYVKKMLSPEIQNRIQKGEIFEIFKEDLFAFDQLGLILCAADRHQLELNLLNQSEEIYKKFEDYHFKRLERILYSGDEQIEAEEFLSKEYGWKVRIPYSYQIVQRSKQSNFVWIKRTEPSRSLFIFRIPGEESMITEDWIHCIRDSIATVYFDGDSISIQDTYTLQTEFNGISAMKMVGIWQNHQQIIGGPFRTYTFYDKDSEYIYLIDLSVVAPGKRKKPYLDQLEVIASTFKFTSTENE